jgi:hypothetical protein
MLPEVIGHHFFSSISPIRKRFGAISSLECEVTKLIERKQSARFWWGYWWWSRRNPNSNQRISKSVTAHDHRHEFHSARA